MQIFKVFHRTFSSSKFFDIFKSCYCFVTIHYAHVCASALHPNCWIKGCELILQGEILNSMLEFSFVSLNLEVCVHYLVCTSIDNTIVVLIPMILYLSTKLVIYPLNFNQMCLCILRFPLKQWNTWFLFLF